MEKKRQKKHTVKRPWNYAIIAFLVVLAIAAGVLLSIVVVNEFTIDLNMAGDSVLTLEYGTEFDDPGATAQCYGTILKKDGIPLKVRIDSDLDISRVGTYTVSYTARYWLTRKTETRTVHVVDTQPPVITLVEDPDHFTLPGQIYSEEGFSAQDGYDGDITDRVAREMTETEVIYTVADASGNTAEVRRPIVYGDKQAPVLTLEGDTEITLDAGTAYVEAGYSAVDNYDGDIKHLVQVFGNVNIWSAGTYTITYTVTDSFGNIATATRTVTVKASQNGEDNVGGEVDGTGKTIYLTFDDGPTDLTLELLEVLSKYNVKATFFVTGSGRLDYLPRIADGGHAIGLHSVTHKYSQIYASDEAFFEDLYKMQDIVEQRTGQKTWLMRFPGGSTNTVSAKYNKGIMTRLTQKVAEKGFHYFDWNVDSEDAGKAKTADAVFKNVTEACTREQVSIVLQHDTYAYSVEAVERIIIWGLRNGFTFDKLSADVPGCYYPPVN